MVKPSYLKIACLTVKWAQRCIAVTIDVKTLEGSTEINSKFFKLKILWHLTETNSLTTV